MKIVRPKYNGGTGEFLGIFETIGYMVVRGFPKKVFFNYQFDKEKSKVFYSHYRRRIPNAFCGNMFNRAKLLVKKGEVESDKPGNYFFLPSITDRSEEINQHFQNVSITPTDIKQKQLNVWADNTSFDPSNLGSLGLEKKISTGSVMKCLKHLHNISSSNIVRNADGLLSRRREDLPVDWICDNKLRVPPQKCKICY